MVGHVRESRPLKSRKNQGHAGGLTERKRLAFYFKSWTTDVIALPEGTNNRALTLDLAMQGAALTQD